jgi:hypothetical protein
MGAGFIRRYTTDISDAELAAIEGVVILDRDPPAAIQGVGTALVVIVAEAEDGPFGVTTQLASGQDMTTTFGGFGFAYNGGLPGSNPCARSRKADSALTPEFWNGNLYIAAWGKTFGKLAVLRVDTSVGSVQFQPLAFLPGGPDFTFVLTTGQHLDVDFGSGPTTATFTGVPGTITSGSGTYPSTFVGGEEVVFAIDGTEYTAVFQAADQSQAQVIARLNLAAGYPAFSQGSSTHTVFTGIIPGTSGSVQIVSLSTLAATATGFTAAGATDGTGNVPNLRAVSATDANTVVSAAVSGAKVDRDANGNLRLTNTLTPGTGTVEVASTSTALAFGFPLEVTATAVPAEDTTIPAGTQVRNGSSVEWVTMQTVTVLGGGGYIVGGVQFTGNVYTVKVRPGLDDGSVGTTGVGTVTTLPNPIPGGAFSVVNAVAFTAALTEFQIDAAYVAAINSTASLKAITKQTNVIVSARQSNLIRTALRSNAITASNGGCYGRTTCIRPPLGTTRATAMSTTATPGVGAYRDERTLYCYPGASVQVPAIAAVGAAGGAGFTNSGQIDVGADTWLASVMSNLNPEENPGQVTPFMENVTDVEANNPDVQNLMIGDYENFKASGIVALRVDDADVIFQSGVTSVDPNANPGRTTIARRRMADYIEDSEAPALNEFAKKLSRDAARQAVVGWLNGFLTTLQSPDNPSASRIQGFRLDGKTLNTPNSLAAGIYKIRQRVKIWPSMDVIVLDTQVGTTVDISEPSDQAAGATA